MPTKLIRGCSSFQFDGTNNWSSATTGPCECAIGKEKRDVQTGARVLTAITLRLLQVHGGLQLRSRAFRLETGVGRALEVLVGANAGKVGAR